MVASNLCDTEPPPRSALEKLAPELLHCILEYLPFKDVLTLRRTCILLSSVGLDCFGTEVPLVSHYDKFRALKEIAKHPVLSQRMKSLFHMCDRPHDVRGRAWKNSWSARRDSRGISESPDPHIETSFRTELHFSPFTFAGEDAEYQQKFLGHREIYLKDVLGNLKFPYLYELAISSCGTTSRCLEEASLRHKDTLRRLTLSHIHMVTEDFRQFFCKIAGQLPELRKVTLLGITTLNLGDRQGDISRLLKNIQTIHSSSTRLRTLCSVEGYFLNGIITSFGKEGGWL